MKLWVHIMNDVVVMNIPIVIPMVYLRFYSERDPIEIRGGVLRNKILIKDTLIWTYTEDYHIVRRYARRVQQPPGWWTKGQTQ